MEQNVGALQTSAYFRHLFTHSFYTLNVEFVGSSPIKGHHCFLEQETLPSLLSTGWFHERIRA